MGRLWVDFVRFCPKINVLCLRVFWIKFRRRFSAVASISPSARRRRTSAKAKGPTVRRALSR